MSDVMGMALIGGSCVLVLMIGFLKRKSWYLVKFLLRGVLGMGAAILLNQGIAMMGYPMLRVGINCISFLTCGILGLPGLAVLYGYLGYKIL